MNTIDETTAVSIVIPVHNEQSCIESTLRELAGVMRRQNRVFERNEKAIESIPAMAEGIRGKYQMGGKTMLWVAFDLRQAP